MGLGLVWGLCTGLAPAARISSHSETSRKRRLFRVGPVARCLKRRPGARLSTRNKPTQASEQASKPASKQASKRTNTNTHTHTHTCTHRDTHKTRTHTHILQAHTKHALPRTETHRHTHTHTHPKPGTAKHCRRDREAEGRVGVRGEAFASPSKSGRTPS